MRWVFEEVRRFGVLVLESVLSGVLGRKNSVCKRSLISLWCLMRLFMKVLFPRKV